MYMKKIFKWSLVIIWMIIIFLFSSMDSYNSNTKSKGIITNIIDKTDKIKDKVEKKENNVTINNNENNNQVNNKVNNTNNERNKKIINLTEKLNKPLRKVVHGLEFLILFILILNALNFNYKNMLISTYISLIYACIDEIHQLFIPNRTGCIEDVLIDMSIIIVILFISTIYKLYKREKLWK